MFLSLVLSFAYLFELFSPSLTIFSRNDSQISFIFIFPNFLFSSPIAHSMSLSLSRYGFLYVCIPILSQIFYFPLLPLSFSPFLTIFSQSSLSSLILSFSVSRFLTQYTSLCDIIFSLDSSLFPNTHTHFLHIRIILSILFFPIILSNSLSLCSLPLFLPLPHLFG